MPLLTTSPSDPPQSWIASEVPALPIRRDESGTLNPAFTANADGEEREAGPVELRHPPLPLPPPPPPPPRTPSSGHPTSQPASSLSSPNSHIAHSHDPSTWSSHSPHLARSSRPSSTGMGNGTGNGDGTPHPQRNAQTTSRHRRRSPETKESMIAQRFGYERSEVFGNEERGYEAVDRTSGLAESSGATKQKRKRSIGQSPTREMDGVPVDGKGKLPRKKPSREESSGLRVDYLAVQQTYTKLLASLPSMFESSSNTSLPAISLDSLKAITEMALFGHSLFLASHSAVTTTSPIIGGRTIASPEPISGDEKQKEVQAVVQACLGCQATDTPEWRRGPLGPRTLCNACGLVFAKLVRKRARTAKDSGGAGGSSKSLDKSTLAVAGSKVKKKGK